MSVYTPIEEWGWTFLLSVHRTTGLREVPQHPDSFRFHLVTRGAALVSQGARYWAEAPCLLCLGSQDSLEVLEEDCEVRTVVFHPGVLNDAFLREDPYDTGLFLGTTRSDQYYLHPFVLRESGFPGPIPLPPVLQQRVESLFARMEDELAARSDNFWPCRTRSYFLETLLLARELYPARTETAAAPEGAGSFLDRVLLHLHVHYADKFSLPELAALFATNRTTLSARFREGTGKSVGDYLLDLRIRVAGVLLRDTTLPVAEVLQRSGFSDPSHFSRLFRRQTGLSPSEYRAKNNWLLRPAS